VKRSDREGRWADIRSARTRFAAEAAFLVLVAAGAALARLSPVTIILLMLVASVLVALIERASSRIQARVPTAAEVPAAEEEPAAPLSAPTASLEERPSRSHVRRLEVEPALPPVNVPAEPEPVRPGPVVTSRPLELPGLEEAEPEAVRAEVPPPVEPPPAPAYSSPPAPRPPAREWNIWDLERRAREQARDAARDEEWSALFVHLREFANADGILPKEFDDLVRESFAVLIQEAA